MSRSSSPSELLYGPTQYAAFLVWVGLQCFMTTEGAIILGAFCIGDGIAPLLGSNAFTFRFPCGGRKSLRGCFGFFLGAIVGCCFYTAAFGLPMLSTKSLLVCGTLSTIAEAIAPDGYDNVIIPLLLHLTLKQYPSLLV